MNIKHYINFFFYSIVLTLQFSCQTYQETMVMVEESSKPISQQEYFTNPNLVVLKTNGQKESYISRIDRVLSLDNGIVISDISGNKVLLFDKKGQYVASTVNLIGKGKNEYIHINDCALDASRQRIFVSCDRPYQLMIFDSNLKLLECVATATYISQITTDSRFLYAFCVLEDNKSYELRRYDKNNPSGGYVVLKSFDEGIVGVRGMGKLLCGNDNHIYFSMPFCNKIYEIIDGKIYDTYTIDFSNNWFSYDKSKNLYGSRFIDANLDKKWTIQNVHATDSVILFNTNDAPFFKVNKNGRYGESYEYFENCYIPYSSSWFIPYSGEKGKIAMEVPAEYINNYLKECKRKGKEINPLIKALSLTDSLSNPILQFLEFKN